jgi:hypothetical protein
VGPTVDFPIKKILVYSSLRNHTSPAVAPNSPSSTASCRPPERERAPGEGEVGSQSRTGKALCTVHVAASSHAPLPSSSQACPAVPRSAAVLLAASRRRGLLPRIQRGWRGGARAPLPRAGSSTRSGDGEQPSSDGISVTAATSSGGGGPPLRGPGARPWPRGGGCLGEVVKERRERVGRREWEDEWREGGHFGHFNSLLFLQFECSKCL